VNYTELKTNIQDICEQTFTDEQLAMFTEQAEQLIFTTVSLPAMRRNQTGNLANGNKYLIYPTDFLYPFSLAVIDAAGDYTYLLNKDVSFIREAYPKAADTGLPVHYGIFDDTAFIIGPTPDAAYEVELHYGRYPESIVTAGTTWLGDEFDSALLNGALVQAIRFMKGEPDIAKMYETLYAQALGLLRNIGTGRLETDTFRSGAVRVPPQ
tara:strand:+ start:136 stop:765 length:630 start_codon:yes stop_codon:yes gene_type:complete